MEVGEILDYGEGFPEDYFLVLVSVLPSALGFFSFGDVMETGDVGGRGEGFPLRLSVGSRGEVLHVFDKGDLENLHEEPWS